MSTDADARDDVILSLGPAPAQPWAVYGVWRDDDGWWSGWAEPVDGHDACALALVERRWYTMPLNARSMREAYLKETERRIEAVCYDPDTQSGLAPASQADEFAMSPPSSVMPVERMTWAVAMATVIEASEWYRERDARRRARPV